MYHRTSSVEFPHSNLRAELGVKVVKRMLRENISSQGELDTDKMGRALLTYRNTPCKILGVSPAQILFGWKLCDHLPTPVSELIQRKEWLLTKEARELALMKRHQDRGDFFRTYQSITCTGDRRSCTGSEST